MFHCYFFFYLHGQIKYLHIRRMENGIITAANFKSAQNLLKGGFKITWFLMVLRLLVRAGQTASSRRLRSLQQGTAPFPYKRHWVRSLGACQNLPCNNLNACQKRIRRRKPARLRKGRAINITVYRGGRSSSRSRAYSTCRLCSNSHSFPLVLFSFLP